MDYTTLRDDELMERVCMRIRRLRTSLQSYGDVVHSVVFRVVGDRYVAEDVTQDVFLRIWRKPEQFDVQRGKFTTWLLSIARNRSIDERRSHGRRQRHEAPPSPAEEEEDLPDMSEADDPALATVVADDRRAVRQALGVLPPGQRLAIQLAYFGGLTQQEIAEQARATARRRQDTHSPGNAEDARRARTTPRGPGSGSMKMDCEVARENIDAYALGVLDRDEAAALEAHVAQCRECASLLDEARERAALIGLSAPLVPASAALKARVMASATVLSSEKFRRRPSASWWTAAAAALVIITAGALAWGAVMQRRASDLRHDRAVAQAEAQQSLQQLASLTAWQDGMLRISAQPDLRTTAMVGTAQAPGARGDTSGARASRLAPSSQVGSPRSSRASRTRSGLSTTTSGRTRAPVRRRPTRRGSSSGPTPLRPTDRRRDSP